MGDSPPVTPQSMTEEQFLEFISQVPPAYMAAASQYWIARGSTPPGLTPGGLTPADLTPAGLTPSGVTPAGVTPAGVTLEGGATPVGGMSPSFVTPPRPSLQPSPTGSTSRHVRSTPQRDTGSGPSRRSRSRSGAGGSRSGSTGRSGDGGGGCCGGSATDVVSPASTPRTSTSDVGTPRSTPRSTPHSTPRTPWGAHDHDDSKVYSIRDGVPVMDAACKAMRARIRQLCSIQFGHSIMRKWSEQDKDRKNYITRTIYQEFRPTDGQSIVSSEWILHTAREVMSHRRSEARDAFREGLPKPVWLDAEEWDMIRDEQQKTLDRYRQQRNVAATRLDTIGPSHLGSGGYDTMRHEFELAMGRPPTRSEESYGYSHGLTALLQDLEGRSAVVSWERLR
ncbi:hypothetical protein KP509_14G048700 [Ceratopteris richardii]|uniref:Uncharacterized protein n=1 Tax=Ceratopteris richardii TaxID=49495 RepID=A0A8T2TBK4_CERRI|nr:hypothetical protein KP509_14G048700 [Ceratopteris richardii]